MISWELASSASLLFAEGHLPGVSVETTGPMRPSRRWPVSGAGVMRGVFPFTGRGPFTAGRERPGHGGLIPRTEWFEGPGAFGQAHIGGGRFVPSADSSIRCSPGDSHSSTGSIRSEEHTSELQSRFDLVCRL